MPWLLASPGHQQQWYWLWNRHVLVLHKEGFQRPVSVMSVQGNDKYCKYMSMVLLKNLACKGLSSIHTCKLWRGSTLDRIGIHTNKYNCMRQGMVFVRAGTLNSSRADSRFAPSQWETVLLCNDVSHWLGTSLKSALLKWLGTQFWLLYYKHI